MARVIVKHFSYKGEEFVIVKTEGRYMAINTKDIDANGTLTKTYYGAHDTISDCIEVTICRIDLQELIASGIDAVEATTIIAKQMMSGRR